MILCDFISKQKRTPKSNHPSLKGLIDTLRANVFLECIHQSKGTMKIRTVLHVPCNLAALPLVTFQSTTLAYAIIKIRYTILFQMDNNRFPRIPRDDTFFLYFDPWDFKPSYRRPGCDGYFVDMHVITITWFNQIVQDSFNCCISNIMNIVVATKRCLQVFPARTSIVCAYVLYATFLSCMFHYVTAIFMFRNFLAT